MRIPRPWAARSRAKTSTMRAEARHAAARRWAGKAFSALFWLSVWALCYRAVGQDLLLASPRQVCARLWQLSGEASFWQTVGASLLRTALAYALGARKVLCSDLAEILKDDRLP